MLQIYKLTSSQTNEVYVGKTTQTLKERLTDHRSDYRQWTNGTRFYCFSYQIIEFDDHKIELIEETNNSLREIYWIQKLNCCNFNSTKITAILEKSIHKINKYTPGSAIKIIHEDKIKNIEAAIILPWNISSYLKKKLLKNKNIPYISISKLVNNKIV